MSYGIAVAVTQRKRAEWERAFGSDWLPVLDVRPRWAEFRGGSVLVYDVAVERLHLGQRNRLAGFVARRHRITYEEARRVVGRGMTVRADGVRVEAADVQNIGRLRLWSLHHASPRRPSL